MRDGLKILVLSPFSVSQHLHGGSVRTRELSKALAQHASSVDVLAFINPVREKERTYYLSDRLRVRELKNWFALVDIVARLCFFPRYVPTLRVFGMNRWRKFPLEEQYDVVLYEFPWLWKLYPDIKAKLHVLDEHNCEFEWFRPYLKGVLFPRKSSSWIRSIEGKAFQEADAVVTCTDDDYRKLAEEYNDNKETNFVVPNGFSEKSMKCRTAEKMAAAREKLGFERGIKLGVFMGSRVLHNRNAVISLHEVVKGSFGLEDWRFLIVGSVAKLLPKNLDSRFQVFGYQEDVTLYWEAADVSLNPTKEGSGSNLKVLDALSRGVAVLSTPCGVRGLDNNLEGIIVRSVDEFPAILRETSTWPVPNAEELRPYCWEQIGTRFYHQLEQSVKTCPDRVN